ncbi:MAG TPA: hypothetical protein VFW73_01935 [Lacipirellulaceae bacterium]|nr:hypothetical protein [Lacipirellulaceae bacterium]
MPATYDADQRILPTFFVPAHLAELNWPAQNSGPVADWSPSIARRSSTAQSAIAHEEVHLANDD